MRKRRGYCGKFGGMTPAGAKEGNRSRNTSLEGIGVILYESDEVGIRHGLYSLVYALTNRMARLD
jgi:hypothetical protein